jgi:bleomycin hydrolase
MSELETISAQRLEQYADNFYQNPANVIAANAATKNGVLEAATDYRAVRKLPHSFNVELEQGSITAQKASGRCWIFAALNTLRYEVIHKWNLKDFELSQNYIFFYDKLEKANYFLESVLKTLDEPVDGRLYSYINAMPLNDGGQWDMFANLVEKYGVVPKEAYPETANSENTRFFVAYLTSKLREFAIELRNASTAGEDLEALRARKAKQLETIYRVLVIALGQPPEKFDFLVKDKDGKQHQEIGITPKEFYAKYVGIDLNDFAGLINAPTADKPFDRTYTVKFLGNVAEGKPVTYLNLPIDIIKAAAIAQLKDGHPVWFGSDCGQFSLRSEGVFDRDSVRVEDLFGIHFQFDKAQRLAYGDSAMNHAMVFQGVNLDENGKPNRWRVENSWGGDVGHKGYYVASDSWFDEFVYQVVVRKEYLPAEVQKLLDQAPIPLEPWDPMGTLAD